MYILEGVLVLVSIKIQSPVHSVNYKCNFFLNLNLKQNPPHNNPDSVYGVGSNKLLLALLGGDRICRHRGNLV